MSQLSNDIDGVVKRFVGKGGKHILSCAVDIESSLSEIEYSMEYDNVLSAIGIHPEVTIPGCDIYEKSVSEEWINKNVSKLESLLDVHKEIIGTGEIGLDYYWVKKGNCEDKEEKYNIQKYLLEKQLRLAVKRNIPVVIHCRDIEGDKQCEADILKVITSKCNSSITGVFHSYTGSLSYLDEILNLGFYISFNSIVMYKNSENVRMLLDKVPYDKLLLETDAPLLVPPKYRKEGYKYSEPSMIDDVGNFVARRKGYSVKKLWDIVDNNFYNLFCL